MSSPAPDTPSKRGGAHSRMISPATDYKMFEDEGAILGENPMEGDGEEQFCKKLKNNMEVDNRPMPALDPKSVQDRVAAEQELRRRDRHEGRNRRDGHDMLYDKADEERTGAPRAKRRRAAKKAAMGSEEQVEKGIQSIENLGDTKGYTSKEWFSMLVSRTEVANIFKKFLLTSTNSKGQFVYKERIRRMCEHNQASFHVEFDVLARRDEDLAILLVEAPFETLQILDKVAKDIILEIFPNYERVTSEIHVRICNLPLIKGLRTFGKPHWNQLVRIVGVITATTGALSQLSVVKYGCNRCGYILGPFVQTQNTEVRPGSCPECQNAGPFMVNMEPTVYRNYQKVTIQESTGRIPAGRIPRSKECILLADLCDRCKPGDEVDLTGIYTKKYDGSLNTEQGFPVFTKVIIANYIVMKDCKHLVDSLTDEDVATIVKDPRNDESDEESTGRAAEKAAMGSEEQVVEGIESIENLEDTKGYTTKEWFSMLVSKNKVANGFKKFLRTYTNSKGQFVYKERIRRMCEHNQASFHVEFDVLARREEQLAILLIDAPLQILPIFDKVATDIVLKKFPNYERVTSEIHVRISNQPLIEELRTFGKLHWNQLVRTVGVITATTGVLPQLSVVKYGCNRCGYTLGPFVQTQNTEARPGSCPECQSAGPFMEIMVQTVYRKYQKVIIQESPGRIPAGRIPRSKECILLADLCDRCKPGDEVDLTGIYTNSYDGSLNTEQGFPVLSKVIIANYIVVKDCKHIVDSLTDEDVATIVNLFKDPHVGERIVRSIAPSIYAHKLCVRGSWLWPSYVPTKQDQTQLPLQPKNPVDNHKLHKVRGDVNVLVCGDPDTAKLQLLKNTEKVIDADPSVTEEDDDGDDSDTPVESNMCRVCLALDVKMYDLRDNKLKIMFQNITGIMFNENNYSVLGSLCWECAARLKAAATFRSKALLSDSLLQDLISSGDQIRKKHITALKENASSQGLISAKTLTSIEVFHIVDIEDQNNTAQLPQSGDDGVQTSLTKNNDTANSILEEIIKEENSELDVGDYDDVAIKTEIECDLTSPNTVEEIRTKIKQERPVEIVSSSEDIVKSTYNNLLMDIGLTGERNPQENCENDINKTVVRKSIIKGIKEENSEMEIEDYNNVAVKTEVEDDPTSPINEERNTIGENLQISPSRQDKINSSYSSLLLDIGQCLLRSDVLRNPQEDPDTENRTRMQQITKPTNNNPTKRNKYSTSHDLKGKIEKERFINKKDSKQKV